MLRRLVLAPALAIVALGTTATPADAGFLCVGIDLTQDFDLPLPTIVPATPKRLCAPVPIEPPITLPPIG